MRGCDRDEPGLGAVAIHLAWQSIPYDAPVRDAITGRASGISAGSAGERRRWCRLQCSLRVRATGRRSGTYRWCATAWVRQVELALLVRPGRWTAADGAEPASGRVKHDHVVGVVRVQIRSHFNSGIAHLLDGTLQVLDDDLNVSLRRNVIARPGRRSVIVLARRTRTRRPPLPSCRAADGTGMDVAPQPELLRLALRRPRGPLGPPADYGGHPPEPRTRLVLHGRARLTASSGGITGPVQLSLGRGGVTEAGHRAAQRRTSST